MLHSFSCELQQQSGKWTNISQGQLNGINFKQDAHNFQFLYQTYEERWRIYQREIENGLYPGLTSRIQFWLRSEAHIFCCSVSKVLEFSLVQFSLVHLSSISILHVKLSPNTNIKLLCLITFIPNRLIWSQLYSMSHLLLPLAFQILAVSLLTTRFNIQKFHMVLALRSVFCTDLRTDSGLWCIRH
jgi:hypothetical protein